MVIFEVCAYLFEFKESENFNHRNILNISRIALKVSADASLRVTKVPKFEPDTEIGGKVPFCKGLDAFTTLIQAQIKLLTYSICKIDLWKRDSTY